MKTLNLACGNFIFCLENSNRDGKLRLSETLLPSEQCIENGSSGLKTILE